MTEAGKFAPGLKGFPTPDTASGESSYLLFLFPDKKWSQWILGATKPLEAEYNWYLSGEMTTDEAAEAFRLINQQAPYNLLSEGARVPAPYWDGGADVDLDATQDAQTWYGELVPVMMGMGAAEPTLDWFENLAIWAFAGFIAYAGQPLAAIAFVPFARKFVLSFKKGVAGAIVRVIFDGLHLADIDTYGVEDEIIDFLVDVGLEPSGQELWVEHSGEHNEAATPNADGDYTIQVVREKLTADSVVPPNTRYNGDCDCVQTTYDDGVTWIDTPARDPRHGSYFVIPPLGEDFTCDAAGGMVELVRRVIASVLDGAEVIGVANSILAILALLSGGAGIIFDLIIVVAEALITIGAATLNGYFDETAYGVLLCAFYCNIQPDGSVTADDVTAISAYIHANASSGVVTVMDIFLNMYGEVQLQNAGVMFADSGADCSACMCDCFTINPTTPWDSAYPKEGLVTSSTVVQGGDGLLYALVGTDCVVWFDRTVTVSAIRFNSGGTSPGSRILITVGTETKDTDYNDDFGHPFFTLATPQDVDHFTVSVSAGGAGLSFTGFSMDFCELP